MNRHHYCSSEPTYHVWTSMLARCYNENEVGFQWYGARGIKVCEAWRTHPAAFILWCKNNGWEKDLQLDRINNDKNYTPENCKFSTAQMQGKNRRLLRSDNQSGYCGVTWIEGSKKWKSQVNRVYLGLFKTAEQAAKVRDRYIIKKNLGLPLNFPALLGAEI